MQDIIDPIDDDKNFPPEDDDWEFEEVRGRAHHILKRINKQKLLWGEMDRIFNTWMYE